MKKDKDIEYKSRLLETSKDKAKKETMMDSEIEVINFDTIKDSYVQLFKIEKINSNDALIIRDDEYLFIEFKNGKIRDIKDVFEIYSKIYDSLIILSNILEKTLIELKDRVSYILVFNKELEHTRKFERAEEGFIKHLNKNSEIERIYFGLRKFEKYCFKKVYTYSVEEFKSKFLQSLKENNDKSLLDEFEDKFIKFLEKNNND